eukprot:evm.model.scf_2055.3 EVM.evm.TU.scf_2055.3   scf_2055:9429-23821(-)
MDLDERGGAGGRYVDSSDEEDGEDVEEYEDDGFVVASEEEEEEEDEEDEDEGGRERHRGRRRKKRRRSDAAFHLDDEDYKLLEEGGVTGVRRPQKGGRKRLKKLGDVDHVDHPRDATQLREELFGDGEGLEDELDDQGEEEDMGPQGSIQEMDEMVDEDGLDGFIVHDEQGQGEGSRRGRTSTKEYLGESNEALRDIFGDTEDLLALYEEQRSKRKADEMQHDVETTGQASIYSQYDPEMMARHGLLPEDEEIRRTDIPERYQQRMVVGTESMNYDAAAEWIYEWLFGLEAHVRLERDLVENGRLEVDGPLAKGIEEYEGKEFNEVVRGHRVVQLARDKNMRQEWREDKDRQDVLKKSIKDVLEHMYKKHEEVPYIGTYCKEFCGELMALRADDVPSHTTQDEFMRAKAEGKMFFPPGSIQAKHMTMRRWEPLWAVYEWSLKWRRLEGRKEKRIEVYERAHGAAPSAASDAIRWCIDALSMAQTMEAIDDIDEKFELIVGTDANLHAEFGRTGHGKTGGVRRKPPKLQKYCLYSKAGLLLLVNELGLVHRLLGKQHERQNQQRVRVSLDDFCSTFVDEARGLPDRAAVLHAAKHLAAVELSTEPAVRQALRNDFIQYAVVTTTPTEAGERVLDPFHVYGRVKHLKNKPLLSFDDSDYFLRILSATKEQFLTYTMGVPNDVFEEHILPKMMSHFMEGDTEALAPGWNEYRTAILQDVALVHLFPALAREQKSKLAESASEYVKLKCDEELWRYASMAPFRATEAGEDGDEEIVEATNVCACVWGPGGAGPATVLVMLDAHGQLKDLLQVAQFSGFIPYTMSGESGETLSVFDDERKSKDAGRIHDFLMEHKPHVIAVGGANLHCRQLLDDLKSIRDNFLSEHPRFIISIAGNMEVVFAPERLAQLWENSESARTELREHPGIVRRAVALGRTLLDPLAVLACLRDHGDTILSLPLYDMQKSLSREERLWGIDQVIMTAVNQLGVNLNLIANIGWQSSTLQFVSGLGPRKAQAILNAIQQNGNKVGSRWELINELGVLDKRVAKNCTGFLRINSAGLPSLASLDCDPLDDSRIHPEHYNLAKRIAVSAVGDSIDEEMAVGRAVNNPELVEQLDLQEYNKYLVEEECKDDSLSLLIDIQMELIDPFRDRRKGYQIPKEHEVFFMLANESPEELKPGKLLEVTVRYVDNDAVYCNLEQSRLEAVINRENVSSSEVTDHMDLRARCKPKDVITARLLAINFKDFRVELTCRSADLQDYQAWEREYCIDKYYEIKSEADILSEKALKAKSKKAQSFVSRPISHPLFKNVSITECMQELREQEVGDCMLRPCSRGFNSIMLSMKTFQGKYGAIYEHREIMEGPKGTGQGTHLRLGLPLTIMVPGGKKLIFDDLDEVIAQYVEKYVARIRAVTSHRKFRDEHKSEIDEYLNEEKLRSGSRMAVYALGIEYHKPGFLYIACIWSESVHHEHFAAVPDGYYFRSQVYRSVDKMLADFKKNPNYKPKVANLRQQEPEMSVQTYSRATSVPRAGLPAHSGETHATRRTYDAPATPSSRHYSGSQYNQRNYNNGNTYRGGGYGTPGRFEGNRFSQDSRGRGPPRRDGGSSTGGYPRGNSYGGGSGDWHSGGWGASQSQRRSDRIGQPSPARPPSGQNGHSQWRGGGSQQAASGRPQVADDSSDDSEPLRFGKPPPKSSSAPDSAAPAAGTGSAHFHPAVRTSSVSFPERPGGSQGGPLQSFPAQPGVGLGTPSSRRPAASQSAANSDSSDSPYHF